jgi:nitric oxide reductase subunit B
MKSYESTFSIRRLWWILGVGMLIMFAALLYFGSQIYQLAP